MEENNLEVTDHKCPNCGKRIVSFANGVAIWCESYGTELPLVETKGCGYRLMSG